MGYLMNPGDYSITACNDTFQNLPAAPPLEKTLGFLSAILAEGRKGLLTLVLGHLLPFSGCSTLVITGKINL